MAIYVVVEGHGEESAVLNLLTRLAADLGLDLGHFARPIRANSILRESTVERYAQLVRGKRDAKGLLVLCDDEDGCPKDDAPRLAQILRKQALPFPAAIVLAYREYESLFLPCISHLAGKPLPGPGGDRAGIRPGVGYDGDFEAKRGVKEWLTKQMPPGRAYKPSVDQLPLTRMVDFSVVRESGLPWFGSLERATQFLSKHRDQAGAVYPSPPSP